MTVWGVVSDCEALAAVFMLFELINHRDREILHRNVTVAPGVSHQWIAAKSTMAFALTGSAARISSCVRAVQPGGEGLRPARLPNPGQAR